ncbi:MAG: helix-turn-helix transcriptional regulator [Leptolyngbyaceae cyanobacterium MO_188.B28]|nr:helix-turn-helix transcriptional regulator [Leptolyngbyaceae cyanobacterium MO_188.B28]
MTNTPNTNYTAVLQHLMQQGGISSFTALSRQAGVSDWQVKQLRQGQAARMRIEPLLKLSQALGVTLADLLDAFGVDSSKASGVTESENQKASQGAAQAAIAASPPDWEAKQAADKIAALEQEYQRLQAQFAQQEDSLQQKFQQDTLQTLESWLLQWPTVAYAVQQNPQIPASRLLPLLRPMENLLTAWEVSAIAPVGSEIPYDPQRHQLMEGYAQPGDPVKVRYTGYFQKDKLLHRAKVSPFEAS